MIKYSPELERDVTGDWSPDGDMGLSWCCEGLHEYWNLFDSDTCWIAISDKPVRGAMALCVRESDRFPGELELRIARKSSWGHILSPLEDAIRSLNTDRVWLWIEIPNE